MRTADHINQWRLRNHPQMGTTDAIGMNGAFFIPLDNNHRRVACCVVSDGTEMDVGWEHVSVRIGVQRERGGKRRDRIPNWEEMCHVKSLFFTDDECVVQFHPAKKDYVNTHPCVLHLWMKKGAVFPIPPKVCV